VSSGCISQANAAARRLNAGDYILNDRPLLSGALGRLNGDKWAFSDCPLPCQKADGRLSRTVVANLTSECHDLVGSRPAAYGRHKPNADGRINGVHLPFVSER
jgi:hypothetical protein